MKITRDNYEPFFLDYLEGNLEENRIDEFLDFLETNPDLKEELQLFENVRLPEDHIVFSEKDRLYKSQDEAKASLEHKTIAYLEGDLDKEERKLFEAYLAGHPELQKDYQLFSKTKLVPDTGIIFQAKKKLYKKSGAVIFMNWAARAAAVIILLWGINSVINTSVQPGKENTVKVTAEVNSKPEPLEKKIEPEINILASKSPEKPKALKNSTTEKTKHSRKLNNTKPEEFQQAEASPAEREIIILAQISPITTQLDQVPVEAHLAVSRSNTEEKITDQRKTLFLEEYLAEKAKKVSSEGLLSAQRIARAGLGLVAEISGERIGYSVKDGKISSLDFESKLLAFSIPLEKK